LILPLIPVLRPYARMDRRGSGVPTVRFTSAEDGNCL
jgi:hypothetical protein